MTSAAHHRAGRSYLASYTTKLCRASQDTSNTVALARSTRAVYSDAAILRAHTGRTTVTGMTVGICNTCHRARHVGDSDGTTIEEEKPC